MNDPFPYYQIRPLNPLSSVLDLLGFGPMDPAWISYRRERILDQRRKWEWSYATGKVQWLGSRATENISHKWVLPTKYFFAQFRHWNRWGLIKCWWIMFHRFNSSPVDKQYFGHIHTILQYQEYFDDKQSWISLYIHNVVVHTIIIHPVKCQKRMV